MLINLQMLSRVLLINFLTHSASAPAAAAVLAPVVSGAVGTLIQLTVSLQIIICQPVLDFLLIHIFNFLLTVLKYGLVLKNGIQYLISLNL